MKTLLSCTLAILLAMALAWPQAALANDDNQRAKLAFETGAELFADGAYEAAIPNFQKAYDLSGNVNLLLSISSCHQKLGNLRAAIKGLEEYISLCSHEERLAKARTRLAELETTLDEAITPPCREDAVLHCPKHGEKATIDACLAEHAEALSNECRARQGLVAEETPESPALPETPEAPVDTPDEGGFGLVEWGFVGAGVALVAGGATSITLGELQHQDVVDQQDTMLRSDAEQQTGSGDLKKAFGYGLLGVGGASLIAGIVLGLTNTGEPDQDMVSAGFAPTSDGGVFMLLGRF